VAASIELQVNVEDPPGAITEGYTESVAEGTTLTVAVAGALVPPRQNRPVCKLSARHWPDGLGAAGRERSVQPPVAVQEVALVELHMSIDALLRDDSRVRAQCGCGSGAATMLTVGGLTGAARPVHDRVKVAFLLSAPVLWLRSSPSAAPAAGGRAGGCVGRGPRQGRRTADSDGRGRCMERCVGAGTGANPRRATAAGTEHPQRTEHSERCMDCAIFRMTSVASCCLRIVCHDTRVSQNDRLGSPFCRPLTAAAFMSNGCPLPGRDPSRGPVTAFTHYITS